MEDRINTKLRKGYKFLRPQEPEPRLKPEPAPEQPLALSSMLGKRPNPNEQSIIAQAGEISKRIHTSSTSYVLNPQSQTEEETEATSIIVIDDEEDEIEETIDENSLFIGWEEFKKFHKKYTKDDEDN